MKNNRKNIIIIICIIFVIIGICAFFIFKKIKGVQTPINNINTNNNDYQKEYEELKENSIMYDESSTIDELKEEYKITGDNEIYQVETESDGRKVLNVKPNVNYKVAFSGMIKNAKPEFGEIDKILDKYGPDETGIWITEKDREKIIEILNNNEKLQSEYIINDKGYLNIKQENQQTDLDKKIQEIINSDKQYVLCISSICYMVDPVTGEIVDNPYNELEEYQTYEYFKDEDRIIIFITENKDLKMTNTEILESVVNLMELQ